VRRLITDSKWNENINRSSYALINSIKQHAWLAEHCCLTNSVAGFSVLLWILYFLVGFAWPWCHRISVGIVFLISKHHLRDMSVQQEQLWRSPFMAVTFFFVAYKLFNLCYDNFGFKWDLHENEGLIRFRTQVRRTRCCWVGFSHSSSVSHVNSHCTSCSTFINHPAICAA
jgi:hypothetical protein